MVLHEHLGRQDFLDRVQGVDHGDEAERCFADEEAE
jgi:hypothetical protein